MKKVLCVTFILLLAGCATGADIKPVTRGLSFTAEMTYYNEYYEMSVDISQNGDTKIALTHPEELNGLIFSYKNGSLTAEFKSIACEIDDSYKTAAVNFLYSVFENENQKSYKNNDRFFTKGQCDGGEYTMYIGETGLPLKISDSSDRFEIIINNATLNKEK